MQRNKEQPFERQSRFNGNRSSYLDSDFNYVYEYQSLRNDGTYFTKKCVIPYSEEMRDIFIVLDGDDHDFDLGSRYADDNADGLFRQKQQKYAEEESGDDPEDDRFKDDPIDCIPDKNVNVFIQAFPEYKEIPPEDPRVNDLREWIFTLPESQQNLIFAHMGEMKFLEDIRREEEAETGKKITQQAMYNRWDKILAKACKRYGVPKPRKKKR